MSTPSDGYPWVQPGGPNGSNGTGGAPAGPVPSGYGTPSSPSYGKYGQGTALPVPPPAPAGGPQWGQPGYTSPQQPKPQQPPPQWGGAGGPTEVKPIGGLQTALTALSVLTAVGFVAAAGLAPNQHQMLKDAFNGVVSSTQPAPAGSQVLSSTVLLLEVCVWAVASVWLTRARQNAMLLTWYQPRRSEAWIWLSWIIPVVNFWFPKQVVDDVIAATAQASGRPRIGTGWWWTAWVTSTLLGSASAASTFFPPNPGLHTALVAAEAVVVVISLLLWLRIVRWVSAAQDERAAPPTVVTLGQ